MSRLGSAIALCTVVFSCMAACGDKLLPQDPNSPSSGVGGQIAIPTADAAAGLGTQPDADTSATDALAVTSAGADAVAASDSSAPEATPPAVTYTKDIRPLLEEYCTPCHSSAGGQPPLFDTYAGAKAAAFNAVDDLAEDMPPSGPRMSAAQQLLFQNWVKEGEPQ